MVAADFIASISADDLTKLTDEQLDCLRALIEDEHNSRTEVALKDAIISEIKRQPVDDFDQAVKVVFETSEWENGYFYCSSGEVTDINGDTVDVDFSDTPVDDLLTELADMHSLGADSELVIDLTGEGKFLVN